ncbi:hypothetical protein B0I35DRAFT_446127 [Stachybotrys elegans]|uniref:Uncharacterized protein n=1 Tax=Stachybotrys elegans TaxID=80388 RepID=A0A8K0WJ56_9HYPO|nr:hypothetical protein B0I35DRAFT_446127 [Stachybotrys elegans]
MLSPPVSHPEHNDGLGRQFDHLAIFPQEPLPELGLTHVDQDSYGGYYGLFDMQVLAGKAAAFVGSRSNGDAGQLVPLFEKFLTLAQQDCASDPTAQPTHSCWLCIRMTLPTDVWTVPRWHTDGIMFDCTCPEPRTPHSKYAFTLLGPSTRVIAPDPMATAVLLSPSDTGDEWDQNEPDSELASRLSGYAQATLAPGQVFRFSWGHRDSPIHSEPDSTGLHRVFVSILFGGEAEIQDMCESRGAQYGCWE